MFWSKSRRSSAKQSRPRSSFKPRLEELETRLAPAVFNVTPTAADGAPGSLRDAINQANTNRDASNTINLTAGTYSLTDETEGNLVIRDAAGLPGKTLTLVGAGQGQTIVEPGIIGWHDRIFEVIGKTGASQAVVMRGLSIEGGHATDGGVLGGTAALGGGLLDDGGNVTLTNVGLVNNQAVGDDGRTDGNGNGTAGESANGGGLYLAAGILFINNSTFTNNLVQGGNGGDGITGSDGNSQDSGSAGSEGTPGAAGSAGSAGGSGSAPAPITGQNGGKGATAAMAATGSAEASTSRGAPWPSATAR